MFLNYPSLTPEMEVISENIQKKFSVMPPHWKFLLSINPKRFQMFINEITYLLEHPNINPDLFAMIRLYIATKENFTYCKSFNTKLLLANGYSKKVIKEIKENIGLIPLDARHQVLAKKAINAVYNPKDFTNEDIQELKDLSWSDSDIYDVIDHSAFLFKNAKIIKAYSL